jgi:hypothetical protein
MNSYEQKIEARKARLEARAARKTAEGDALYTRAHKMAEAIPFGQPILIGHHSEGRDRNYRGKIHSTFGRAFEAMDEAKELASRAASVGTGGISSDDPDAVIKLKAELAECEANQAKMVAANKLVRKGDVPGLIALGYPESIARKLLEPDCCGRKGFPGYMTSSNGANMRRLQGRIEQLQKAATREHKEILHSSGVRLVQNVEANRIQLIFPGKPDEATRKALKCGGFRWSPAEGAWQRQLNNAGIYAAQNFLRQMPVAAP